MEDEMHPVILLLAARKKSHPEEFSVFMQTEWAHPQETGRWGTELALLNLYMTGEEKSFLFDNRRDLIFDNVMKRVMHKLLEGAGSEQQPT